MKHPLTNEHYECLCRALQGGFDIKEYLEACKRCGLPVDEMIQDVDGIMDRCSKIKREFFPNQP